MKNYGRLLLMALALLGASGCLRSEVLAPEPSALDLDDAAPECPGLTGVSVGSGPSLVATWAEGRDQLTQTSNLTYSIFMKSGTNNYDLVSPAKIVIGATIAQLNQGIQLGQTYTLFVTCKDEKGNSAPKVPSKEISVTVSDEIPPAAPGNLTIGSANFTSLLLNWVAADDGPGGTTASQMKYLIYRSSTASVSTSGSPLVTLTASTAYTDQNLNPGTTYYYRVVAQDLAGNRSQPSNEASGTTLTDTSPPTLIPNLSATGITSSQITLGWSPGSDNVTAPGQLIYRVYRCAGATTCDPYASTHLYESAPGQLSYTNSGLIANTIYVFGVRAVDSSGNVSTNTERLVTNTAYNNLGTFDFYPTPQEVQVYFGHAVAVGNVVGASTGPTAFPDLIVGAPNASEGGIRYVRTGCIYIFPGTATGVFSLTPSQTICQENPTADGPQNSTNLAFGTSMVSGDLDGNGTADLVVGSPRQDRVVIFLSEANGAGVLSIGQSPSPILRLNQGPVQGASGTGGTGFGMGLCLGNSDNDGALDIFVISPYENACVNGCGGRSYTGNVVVYRNSSQGGSFTLPSSPLVFSPTVDLYSAPTSFNISTNERVVWSCTAGKLDPNNPNDEILVLGSGYVDHDTTATPDDGILTFYRRPAASPNTWNFVNAITAANNNPPQLRNGLWGFSVEAVEVDGGGTKELFVGAPQDNSAGDRAGAVYGYSVTTNAGQFVLTDLGTYYYGGSDQNNNWAGVSLAAGNIWGHSDGKQDLVIGAPFDDRQLITAATSVDIGNVFTHRNSGGIINAAIQQQGFDISAVNARIDNWFGSSLCRGDVNNDGLVDILVGSAGQSYDPISLTTSNQQGALYVFYGRSSGEIDFSNPNQMLFGPGNQGGAYFGNSCVVLDYNGDGLNDLLVGSPYRDVGNYTDRGSVFVYFGSSNSDLQLTPSSTLHSPDITLNSWPWPGYIYFGWSLAKGDIDANGKDDLIVGSPAWDSGGQDAGGAWIFWASDSVGVGIQSSNYTTLLPPIGDPGTTLNPHLANPQQNGGRVNITAMSRSGNVVTVTTGTTHHYMGVRNRVTIKGSTSPSSNSFNGQFTVTAINNYNQFTFSQVGPNETAGIAGSYMQQLPTGGNIVSMSRGAGNVVTVNTAEPHGLTTGSPWIGASNVFIWGGISPSGTHLGGGMQGYNYPVTATPSDTQFRFTHNGPIENFSVTNAFYRRQFGGTPNFGHSVAAFPTVPGSPGIDVVICAPWFDTDTQDIDSSIGTVTDIGNCFIYEGKINGGLVGSYQVMKQPRNEIRFPFATANAITSNWYFGTAMTTGDWDFDGVDDLVICSHRIPNLGEGLSSSKYGGCFAFYGRKDSSSPPIVGGFKTNLSYQANCRLSNPANCLSADQRRVPYANDAIYNHRTEGNGVVTDFGLSVLLVDVNNNIRPDLLIGERLSDNVGGPSNLGRDSGRVHVNRGEF